NGLPIRLLPRPLANGVVPKGAAAIPEVEMPGVARLFGRDRCHLFPRERRMTTNELESAARELQQFPSKGRRLVAGEEDPTLRKKPSEADFSIAENLCHLRDIEHEGYSVRLRRLLEEERPFLPDINGGRLARERDYNSQPVPSALEQFAGERMGNVALLYGLKAEQLSRSGTLEGVGDITVEALLGIMQQHDREHLTL